MTSHPEELDEWVATARAALEADGIDLAALEPDIGLILDLARDAAHGVARPAAPLTTFLLGYASARSDGSQAEVRRIAGILSALAAERSPSE